MRSVTRTALAFLAVASAETSARAQEVIALDNTLTEGRGDYGVSVDGRIGFRTGIPRTLPIIGAAYGLILQFEIVGGYRQLWADTGDLHLGRIGGGIRGGGSIYWFQPFLYTHVAAADANGNWGFMWDLGVALDVRYKNWSFGGHYQHDFLYLAAGFMPLNEIGTHVEFRGFLF